MLKVSTYKYSAFPCTLSVRFMYMSIAKYLNQKKTLLMIAKSFFDLSIASSLFSKNFNSFYNNKTYAISINLQQ